MSRIGKSPILVDDKVSISIDNASNSISVKGPKGLLSYSLLPLVAVKLDGKKIVLDKLGSGSEADSLHGLYRALIQNAVIGVNAGFSKGLELHGVGYRASVTGKKLEMSLGYSHPIIFDIPEGIEVKVEKQTAITVSGYNKELVGQVAAKLRSFRPPEPYLGKGVRYSGEKIRKKAGKSAGK
jgi:large subunit ribosomal protein L6